MSTSKMFISVTIFWIMLTIVFSVIGYTVQQQTMYSGGLGLDKFESKSFSLVNIGDSLTFIFKVMFWSVPTEYAFPQWISLILDLFALSSIFVFVMWIRGVGMF